MTLMMNSPFGLDDMEALLWGPSFPMADPMGSLLPLDEDGTSIEGGASPLSSSFSSSPPPPRSPLPSPPSLLLPGDKPEVDLSLPWLSADELGHSHIGGNDSKEDAFSGLDWMAERVDLSELDLDSLMDSCSADEPPSSPEDLIASLECPMELDSLALPRLPALHDLPVLPVTEAFLPTPASHDDPPEVRSPPPCIPEVQEELEIKSEPASPAPPSPSDVPPPPSPTFALDLGSEVDVSDCDSKPPVPAEVPQVPRIVLSLSPTRIVLLLAPKQEVGITTAAVAVPKLTNGTSVSSPQLYRQCPATAPTKSPRSRPYPSSKPNSNTHTPSATPTVRVKSSSGGPPKEKKLKKMEQNKTAATRYRQKKRVEQDTLNAECSVLERKNQELEEKADSLAREIQYLKELMEEVRLAKSVRSSGTSEP